MQIKRKTSVKVQNDMLLKTKKRLFVAISRSTLTVVRLWRLEENQTEIDIWTQHW